MESHLDHLVFADVEINLIAEIMCRQHWKLSTESWLCLDVCAQNASVPATQSPIKIFILYWTYLQKVHGLCQSRWTFESKDSTQTREDLSSGRQWQILSAWTAICSAKVPKISQTAAARRQENSFASKDLFGIMVEVCGNMNSYVHLFIVSSIFESNHWKVLYLACIPWAWWPLRHTRFCRPSSLSRFGRLESYIQYIRRRKFLVFDHWYRVRPPEIWEIPKFQTKIAAT